MLEIERRRIHEIELGAGGAPGLDDIGQRGTVLLAEAKEEVSTPLDLLQACGIELHAALVGLELPSQLLEGVEAVVEQLLQSLEGWVDALDGAERALDGGELAKDGVLFSIEDRRHAIGERAQLLGVLQPPRLILEAGVLALRELSLLDLARDVTKVVSTALRFGSARGQRCDLPTYGDDSIVRFPHLHRLLRRAPEGVENRALGVAIEQRLRLVLPVQVHQKAPDLREHAGRHRGAVDPRPRASGGGDLTAQH